MEVQCCFQLLWLRVLMRRWFNVKFVDDFSSDELSGDEEQQEENQENAEEKEEEEGDYCAHAPNLLDSVFPLLGEPPKSWSFLTAQRAQPKKELCSTEHLRIAVGTWNVAGKMPPETLHLRDWLDSNDHVDIYVVGFQEIVPLTFGNVCGVQDVQPAIKWQALIRKTINRNKENFDRHLKDKDVIDIQHCDALENDNHFTFEEYAPQEPLMSSAGVPCILSDPCQKQASYVRVVSKQMVGIHISIWVRRNLCRFVHGLSVSCVGLGLMGCLGNKGSIAVSMQLHQTSFCFICAHLTSGHKEGDEKRRNWDAMKVLKRTHFPVSKNVTQENLRSVWGHDRIIWLGDLNYRLNLMDNEIRLGVAKADWTYLFKKDQLRKQWKKGHIFEGWQEGAITFPPTYKYEFGSDQYAGENLKVGDKQRSPAWCDRVLWHGKGLKLLEYKRGESTLSDHRPVIAFFLAEVKVLMLSKVQNRSTDQT